ncbi:hypothetical protein KM043_006903 [Ampulex compressa]|nr:hypothetical protein KM043_006903 [Ampulex compressa]
MTGLELEPRGHPVDFARTQIHGTIIDGDRPPAASSAALSGVQRAGCSQRGEEQPRAIRERRVRIYKRRTREPPQPRPGRRWRRNMKEEARIERASLRRTEKFESPGRMGMRILSSPETGATLFKAQREDLQLRSWKLRRSIVGERRIFED